MQKTMTNKEYQSYVEKKTPNSKTGRNVLRAFLVGGLICVVGQFITNILKMMGYGQEQVSSVVTLIMIFLGALLTGLNIYDDLGRFAGAGSIVPITGFANSIVSPAMEFKSEGYVLGVGARMFVIAGPVLVYGISTSIVAGIIYFLLR
ncbi:stage V sporulation protein AC [Acetivibrio mesophilus]|uniref:Stage V sporulation protein AC n=1 Tax=Acetivibrio mesophilus TaxID=2487273 RepID=A0A4Q0I856_9FIRM|nr:stage V sporulation protein AC [Acetivibrio mesophilus]ODM26031.1 stage V sporulation protein AC [Clostridium sp. Bc-iso-3]RXE59172.1 stage V sporulation protein AC [Acetivibrio mesophilus]HHV29184.1 stage V sporulation protein AC [Clostridium sp.]